MHPNYAHRKGFVPIAADRMSATGGTENFALDPVNFAESMCIRKGGEGLPM